MKNALLIYIICIIFSITLVNCRKNSLFNSFYIQKVAYSISIFKGDSIKQLKPKSGLKVPFFTENKIKHDDVESIADPFILQDRDSFYLFFELVDHLPSKGNVGVASGATLSSLNLSGKLCAAISINPVSSQMGIQKTTFFECEPC